MQDNLAFRATVASAGMQDARVLAANRKTTLQHGATILGLVAFPLESGCFGGRYNRDGGVHARVRAVYRQAGGFRRVCITQSRRVFDGFKNQSRRVVGSNVYSSSLAW